MEVGAGDNPLSQAHPAHWLGSQALVGGARKIAISQTASLLCTHCYLCICPHNLCGGVGTLGNQEMGAHRSEEICGRGRSAGKEISGWLLEIAPNLPPSRDSPACTFNLLMDPSFTS